MLSWWKRRPFLVPAFAVAAALSLSAFLTPCVASQAAMSSPKEPRLFGSGTVSSGDNEFGPAFTPDGQTLFFCRTAPGRTNFQAILVSRRVNGAWSEPDVAPFSGEWKDLDPSISPDGKVLVFASNRPVGGAEARKDYDLDGVYQAPEPMAALNTEFDDSNQYVAPDQSFLVFASDRGAPGEKPPSVSEFWTSRRVDGAFGPPVRLASAVNSGSPVLTPVLTPDGRTFVYATTRGTFDKPLGRRLSIRELNEKFRSPGNGLADLYEIDAAAAGISR